MQVEQSLEAKEMWDLSDDAALARALEISMRETDLMTMLAPRSAPGPRTLYV